jgi:hypothetical protein
MARIGGNAWMMDSARMLTANAVDLGENRRCCRRFSSTT